MITAGAAYLLRSDEAGIDDVAQQTEEDNLRVITTGPLPPNPPSSWDRSG